MALGRLLRVRSLKDRIRIMRDLHLAGLRDSEVRKTAIQAVAGCPARNDMCEIQAIYKLVKSRVRYTGDVQGFDTYASAARTLEWGGGDCFAEGTLLLDDAYRFVPVEELQPGGKIWGRDRWSEVQAVVFKGIRSVDAIRLNNGSWFRVTPDHKVYVVRCSDHSVQNTAAREGGKGRPCSCPVRDSDIVRIRVADLRPTDAVLTPDRVAFGRQTQDPDRAYVDGLFLADGWAESHRFSISGKDGCPKEAQKREVQAICERLGSPTRWHSRYIVINDKEWTLRMLQMGHRAVNKHALTLDLDEGAAGPLLRGIMADSGQNTFGGRMFSSTSWLLAMQTRVLHKMFGISCSWSFVENHGGLGSHPIYRMNVWLRETADGRRAKRLRVKEIARGVAEVPTWDITTDDHFVYLPEADVTVSNCDDTAVATTTLLRHLGFQVGVRVAATGGIDWDHVYGIVGIPKDRPRGYVALDTTVPEAVPGWEAKATKRKDFLW